MAIGAGEVDDSLSCPIFLPISSGWVKETLTVGDLWVTLPEE